MAKHSDPPFKKKNFRLRAVDSYAYVSQAYRRRSSSVGPAGSSEAARLHCLQVRISVVGCVN